MSRYVEPRFDTLGNTFIKDPSDSGDEQAVSGRIQRSHSFSHRAAVHDVMQAPGGKATVCLAAKGLSSSPPSSATPRPSSLSDLELTPDSPSDSGGSGESVGASQLDGSSPLHAAGEGTPGAAVRRGGPRIPKARALYDSNITQAFVESATATPDRRGLPGGVARHLQAPAPLELSPAASKARGRRGRGGKARHLYDSSLSQVSTETDVASPGRHCQAWGDGALSPSPPMSPDVHAPQEVLIADLLRTGSAAMLKAASLANRMKAGDAPRRRGSTGLLLGSLLGGAGSGGCTPLGGAPLGCAAASPTSLAAPAALPQGTPPSPLPPLGAAVVPR